MKNKKNRLVFGLLILTVFLGVGFAVVNSVDLTVGGTVKADEHDMDVYFNGTVDSDDSGCVDCASVTVTPEATEGSLEASITVEGLEKVGDKVTATYTIQNDEPDIDATIALDTTQGTSGYDNDNATYFKVTSISVPESPISAKGGNDVVTIEVELIKVPIEENDSEANIKVYYKATPTQPSN